MWKADLSRAEREEQEYIKECGEKGAETIVGYWLDGFTMNDERGGVSQDERMKRFQERLVRALRAVCTDRELAENVSRLGGGPSLEEWVEDQR